MALMRSEGQGHLTDRQRKLIETCAPGIRDAVATGLALERRQLDLIGGTLDHLDIAAFAVNAQCGIVSMSQAAETLLASQDYLSVRARALSPILSERQAAFAEAVAATRRDLPASERRAGKLLLPSLRGGPLLLAEILPLPIDSEGWLHTACCLMTVRRRGERLNDLPAYMQHRYRLTASECAVVMLLVDGLTPREIAESRGVGEGTVRNQIKAVLAKTGFRRQVDLLRELRL
jgi:DNA-binding CsgD family transcriptional regulator